MSHPRQSNRRRPSGLRVLSECAVAGLLVPTLAAASVSTPAPSPPRPTAPAESTFTLPPASVSRIPDDPSAAAPAVLPAARPATRVVSAHLVHLQVPALLWDAYTSAALGAPAQCHLPATLLAAIGQVESGSLAGRALDAEHRAVPAVLGPVLNGHGFAAIRDTDHGAFDGDTRWDRAVGPMQFIPGTWATWGRDADGDGRADPQDIDDAAASAAAYLCAGGRDLASENGLRSAILSYNHSDSYVTLVLRWKRDFEAAPPQTVSIRTAQVAEPVAVPVAEPVAVAQPVVQVTLPAQPSAAPTAQPTAHPTAQPTAHPTTQPTAQPTPSPSASPSVTPSTIPSEEPTAEPTEGPEACADPEPTAAPSPTADPSTSPSASPSPTAEPTDGLDPTDPTEPTEPTGSCAEPPGPEVEPTTPVEIAQG